MRKLVIFGNGLGRALDNDFYDLEKSLKYAWNDSGVIDQTQKRLIQQCLPEEVLEDESATAPRKEEELDRLQRVLAACDEIAKYEVSGGERWLNDHGKQFPQAIRSYLHSAASYFHSTDNALPEHFIQPLIKWVNDSRSHIVTLNYDDLLYRAFTGSDVFSGYSCLIDGFVPNFESNNLNRRKKSRQAYYLHLHGSPLYYTDARGVLKKMALSGLPFLEGHSTSHVVLTHVDHKSTVILASPILKEYWARMEEALNEVDAVILFGYGGKDEHLNSLLKKHRHNKQLEIVERRHTQYAEEDGKQKRFDFWKSRVGTWKALSAHWRADILSFTNWDYKHAKFK